MLVALEGHVRPLDCRWFRSIWEWYSTIVEYSVLTVPTHRLRVLPLHIAEVNPFHPERMFLDLVLRTEYVLHSF